MFREDGGRAKEEEGGDEEAETQIDDGNEKVEAGNEQFGNGQFGKMKRMTIWMENQGMNGEEANGKKGKEKWANREQNFGQTWRNNLDE